MCDLFGSCKKPAEYKVIHKAIMARPERTVMACHDCASRIGSSAKGPKLIDTKTKESLFYRIEAA